MKRWGHPIDVTYNNSIVFFGQLDLESQAVGLRPKISL